jgi:Uncharacterized protein conserved in bacteria
MAENWITEVLTFWFKELEPSKWFAPDPDVDQQIATRFKDLWMALSANPPAAATTDPRAALAAVIVLDQFPRNMFRGTAQAFVTDDLALFLARQALDARLDEKLAPEERLFLYMPFQHSEIAAVQNRSVALFEKLGMEEPLRYAKEHRDIVYRFGRFPHRNKVLGRHSTEAELEFMAGHAGFGQ